MYKVLFVCTGNICRSPTAHGVFEHLVKEEGLSSKIYVDSAGTGSWHEGALPDPRAMETALKNGIDISSQRARQVRESDMTDFDLIIALDRSHYQALKPFCKDLKKLRLMMEFAPEYKTEDVPDPYYGGKEGFQNVFDMVHSSCRGLLSHIKQEALECR